MCVAAYFHQKDVIRLRCGHQLLHLSQIHGQRFLTQDVLLSIKKHHAYWVVMGMDGAQIYHIYT